MDNEPRASKQTESLPVLKAQLRKNYGGKFSISGGKLTCYTKKQMRNLYPRKQFKQVAEFGPKRNDTPISELIYNNTTMQLSRYGFHSRLLHLEKGFVAIENTDDSFVVLLKNVLLPRIAVLLTCLALIVVIALFALNPGENIVATIADETISQANILDLEEGAVDWEGTKPVNTGGVSRGIAIPGFKSITISADSSDIKVNLYNPENNPCYFVISIILDDGTALYKSKMIEPGKGVYDITLTKPLESGEYGAIIKYETYDLESLGPMNGASVKFTFIVR